MTRRERVARAIGQVLTDRQFTDSSFTHPTTMLAAADAALAVGPREEDVRLVIGMWESYHEGGEYPCTPDNPDPRVTCDVCRACRRILAALDGDKHEDTRPNLTTEAREEKIRLAIVKAYTLNGQPLYSDDRLWITQAAQLAVAALDGKGTP